MGTASNASAKYPPDEQTVDDEDDERIKIDMDPEDALRLLLRTTKPDEKK